MKNNNLLFATIGVLLFQIFIVDFLTINLIRPDFLLIYVFYIAILYGRLLAIIVAFTLGLLSDLFGVGSYFGLGSLTLSTTAYLSGFLYNKYERLLPYVFHSIWIGILLLHFYINTYFRFQTIFVSDIANFVFIWLTSFSYTMIFLLIMQYFYPIKQASRVKIN
jgi:rod shape-determining protein MreD